jgi:hypothetical protein
MIRIPQHARNGKWVDLNDLLPDLDRFVSVHRWNIHVRDCQGSGSTEIEDRSWPEVEMDDAEFRALYRGIYQTIDGRFTALRDGVPVCVLEAVDSTFWVITGPPGLEAHLRDIHGEWQP